MSRQKLFMECFAKKRNFSQTPTLAVFATDVLLGLGHTWLHVGPIPHYFFTRPHGQISEEHCFRKGPGMSKIRKWRRTALNAFDPLVVLVLGTRNGLGGLLVDLGDVVRIATFSKALPRRWSRSRASISTSKSCLLHIGITRSASEKVPKKRLQFAR